MEGIGYSLATSGFTNGIITVREGLSCPEYLFNLSKSGFP
jgi:hypothetical protein